MYIVHYIQIPYTVQYSQILYKILLNFKRMNSL